MKYDRYAFTRDSWDGKQTKLNEKDEDESHKIVKENNKTYYFHEALSEDERASIEKYEGYYIGRYEVGCDVARTSHTAITLPRKVKLGLRVYNYITRDEAITVSERMYDGKSKLCSSYAWDTALKFIDGETGTYAVNSEGGNYIGNGGLKTTGYHFIKNIYDMGGNIYEWTTEKTTNSNGPYVDRGGYYDYSALNLPASTRNYVRSDGYYQFVGVRCAFYI